jgi:hypothetical protein
MNQGKGAEGACGRSLRTFSEGENTMEQAHSGSERRTGKERRKGDERRTAKKPLATDFRSGSERRAKGRRTSDALRQILGGRILAGSSNITPATFSRKEAASIRAAAADANEPLVCPRCDKPLVIGPEIERKGELIRELLCRQCHRCVMVGEFATR